MPKGTVITIPGDEVPGNKSYPVCSARRGAFKGLFGGLYSLLVPLFCRKYWIVGSLAFLLSRVSLVGELSPFGLAFFAAAAGLGKGRAIGVAFGVLAGILSTGRYLEAGTYIFSIIFYYCLAGKLVSEGRLFKSAPLLVFGGAALGGTLLVVWQNAPLYQSLLVIFNALIGIALAYIFMAGFKLLAERPEKIQVNREMLMSLVIILAVSIAGLGHTEVAGYRLLNITGGFIVLTMALSGGAGLGAAVGVVIGLIAGLADGVAATMISQYAIAGLLAGSFQPLGKLGAAGGFLLGCAITALYSGESIELGKVLSEGGMAAALLMAVPQRWLTQWNVVNRERQTEQVVVQYVQEASAKLTSVAQIFSSLAAAGHVSASKIARQQGINSARIFSAVGEQVCGPCRRRRACWEENFNRTHQAMSETATRAGKVELIVADLPKHLKESCLHARELAEVINTVVRQSQECSFWQKEIAAARQAMAEQLSAVSGIVDDLAVTLDSKPVGNLNLAAQIKAKAALLDCQLEKVKVTSRKGVRKIEINKASCAGNKECINTVMPLITNLTGRKLTLHSECGSFSKKKCHLSFQVIGQYSVQTGVAGIAKEFQGISGDTSAVVPIEKDRLALLLSDGMGSGSRAAGESSTTVEYLKRLLTAGFAFDAAVKMVNNMLLLRDPDESFATVDMAVIDTCAGEAEFIKVGSAPSYIKRVCEIMTIKSAALPIGILNQVEIETVKWHLAPGDVIVMVSDGIIDIPSRGEDKEPWLANYLRRAGNIGPQELADKILQQAVDLSKGYIRDDMTVIVAKIGQGPGFEDGEWEADNVCPDYKIGG